jgi:predicted DNA-binding transcriptional regulator AlpA
MEVSTTVQLLTFEEMAAKLRISIRTLQYMMRDGTAPEHVRLGTRVLFVVREASHADG